MDPWETIKKTLSISQESLGSACKSNPLSEWESPEKQPPHWDSSLTRELRSDNLTQHYITKHATSLSDKTCCLKLLEHRSFAVNNTVLKRRSKVGYTHVAAHTQGETGDSCQSDTRSELLSASLDALHLSLWPLAWMLRWRDGSSRK